MNSLVKNFQNNDDNLDCLPILHLAGIKLDFDKQNTSQKQLKIDLAHMLEIEEKAIITFLINKIKYLSNNRIIELLIVLKNLKIRDKYGVEILSKVALKLTGMER